MQTLQLVLTLAVLGMLVLVYAKVNDLSPDIKVIASTADKASKQGILGFL